MNIWNKEPLLELSAHLKGADFERAARLACDENPWFTPHTIQAAAEAIRSTMLSGLSLREWLSAYSKPSDFVARRVGIVMAGNIPMVGILDLVCAVVAGHRVTMKPSSKDRVLMEYVAGWLNFYGADIEIVGALDRYDVDAVIATGSDATRDHFLKEFRGMPSLIRGNRYSVAVLTGREDEQALEALTRDIFLYWGLGCRNVSRLYLPRGFDLAVFAEQISRYANSFAGEQLGGVYRHSRAMAILNGEEFTDCGFFMLRPLYGSNLESTSVPVGSVGYLYYDDLATVNGELLAADSQIQCVVGDFKAGVVHPQLVEWGMSQSPSLEDYPDGVDVMDFLLKL